MDRAISSTPIGYDAIDLSWINGRVITQVAYREPTYWSFMMGTSEGIAVECLWRIVRAGRVVRTGLDHGQQFGLPAPVDAARDAMEFLSGACVVHVRIREATGGIFLTFDDDVCLEIIPDSSGYESWHLYAPAGRCYVAQGGGQICTWSNEAEARNDGRCL